MPVPVPRLARPGIIVGNVVNNMRSSLYNTVPTFTFPAVVDWRTSSFYWFLILLKNQSAFT